jgi:hypothetical protein
MRPPRVAADAAHARAVRLAVGKQGGRRAMR